MTFGVPQHPPVSVHMLAAFSADVLIKNVILEPLRIMAEMFDYLTYSNTEGAHAVLLNLLCKATSCRIETTKHDIDPWPSCQLEAPYCNDLVRGSCLGGG